MEDWLICQISSLVKYRQNQTVRLLYQNKLFCSLYYYNVYNIYDYLHHVIYIINHNAILLCINLSMVEKVYVFKLLSVFRFVYMDIDDKHCYGDQLHIIVVN